MQLLLITALTLSSILTPVPRHQDFFTGDWNTDDAKIVMLRDYMRQTEKEVGAFDSRCGQFAHIGKVVQTPEHLRPIIEQALAIHNSRTNVCFFERLPDKVWSTPGGHVFWEAKTANKLTPNEFLAVLGHELGHRYAFRVVTWGREEEHFADIISAWTMIQAGRNPLTLHAALYKLTRKNKGGSTHPGHEERLQAIQEVVDRWELRSPRQLPAQAP